MGLLLCYDLTSASGVSVDDLLERVARIRERALELTVAEVSEVVRLSERDLATARPMRGLGFERLADWVYASARSARAELYSHSLGIPRDDWKPIAVPPDLPFVGVGFAVALGPGSEPATLGLARIAGDERPSRWWWHECCKTQYASVHGSENLITCHSSLVELLETAQRVGIDITVRDETGYWASRNTDELIAAVARMNQIVAKFAGAFTDAMRAAGGDTRRVEGAIFHHPDFERLEGE